MTAITEFDHVSRLIYYDVTLSDLTGCDTLLMGLTGSDVAAVMAGTQRPLSGPSRPCSTGRFYCFFFYRVLLRYWVSFAGLDRPLLGSRDYLGFTEILLRFIGFYRV